MSKRPGISVGTAVLVVIGVLLMALLVLGMLGRGNIGLLQIVWHLLTGFVVFLKQNLAKVSTDAGTWGPGLAAFLLAIAVIHRFGASWSKRRGRPWRISTAAALGMFLPLLFGISFLAPGMILHIGQLAKGSWFQSNRPDKAIKMMDARNIAIAAYAWAAEKESDRFPPSMEAIVSEGFLRGQDLMRQSHGNIPGEPALYLGTGLTLQSDPTLPLVISDIYSSRNRTLHRVVITVGNEFVEIRPEEVDEWIARAIDARSRTKP